MPRLTQEEHKAKLKEFLDAEDFHGARKFADEQLTEALWDELIRIHGIAIKYWEENQLLQQRLDSLCEEMDQVKARLKKLEGVRGWFNK